MSCQAIVDEQQQSSDQILRDDSYSPPQQFHYQNTQKSAINSNDNLISLIACDKFNQIYANENYIKLQQQQQQQQELELNNSSYMNGHQTHQMQNHNPMHYPEIRQDPNSSLHLSNRQFSPSTKQYYQQLTPPYSKSKNFNIEIQSDSLNKSSNTNTKRNDLLEFELLERQVNMESNITNNDTQDIILSNNTDRTAQEILNAAATPIANVSQIASVSQVGEGDKKIKMKPTLKKNYMSLEQLQNKCQFNSLNDNLNLTKNYQYNSYKNEDKQEKGNYNITQQNNSIKQNVNTNDSQDIFNKYALANSESIDQQTDSLQQLLERAFQSKQKYEQSSSNHQTPTHNLLKPPPPMQLEKQINSSLPPPSPINIQNQQMNHANTQKQGKESTNKISLQFTNILESLKKTNSSTTIMSSHTIESKSFSQQNLSTAQCKSGNKTPSSTSNLTAILYQNDGCEKILVDIQPDQITSKKGQSQQISHLNGSNSNGNMHPDLLEFNQNENEENPRSSTKQLQEKNKKDIPQIGKSQSHANLPSQQQRSISLSTAQDYARILNRRRSSSRRMSSKGSIGSIDSKRQQPDLIQKEIKELNAFFSALEQEQNEFDENNPFQRSMSNKKLPLKSSNALLLRLNQDLERRRVIQQEQLKQKDIKSKKNVEEIQKQTISRGKLSRDEEKSLVNKLFDDANRRQNIQVMQQKMKKIEEQQREKSLEAQRESQMKRNTSIHNSSLYANVQSKIKQIIECKPNSNSNSNNVNSNNTNNSITHNNSNSHSQSRKDVIKHNYSKKNQNRTISPILKRTSIPLQASDSKTQLNKTQLALKQFQFDKFDDQQNQFNHNHHHNVQGEQQNNYHHQQTKSTNFMDNLHLQFYTPSKPLINEHLVDRTLTKGSYTSKSTKQLNNSTHTKQQYTIQNQNQKASNYKNVYQDTNYNYHTSTKKSNDNIGCNQVGAIAPPSVTSIKRHLSNIKSNLRVSAKNVTTSTTKRMNKNDTTQLNKENGSQSKSLSKKPRITINVEDDDQQHYNSHPTQPQISNQLFGINNQQIITPSSNTHSSQNHNSSSQHNGSQQTPQYVSMKCTNSFFREKNPSTLAAMNQNLQKINRQMQYQFTTGNQTSKNSSHNQSQQQSMKNSYLFTSSKTPTNMASNSNNFMHNNLNINNNGENKKSVFSFNQSEVSMDDQQFLHSKQNKQNLNYDTIKINIAQNKAQIIDPQLQVNSIPENNLYNNQNKKSSLNQNMNVQINEKQEKLESINQFISQNPNFIQFMIEQYNMMQYSNNNNNNNNMGGQTQQMEMNPAQMMNQYTLLQNNCGQPPNSNINYTQNNQNGSSANLLNSHLYNQMQQYPSNSFNNNANFISNAPPQNFQNNNNNNNVQSYMNGQSNKILTVDDLLDLDQQDNNQCTTTPMYNSPYIPSKLQMYGSVDNQHNLISMSDISSNSHNQCQKEYNNNNNNNNKNNNGYSFNQNQSSSLLNYQIQNILLDDDQSGKPTGSFYNLRNSGQKLEKNTQSNNQYQAKSMNSLEYQDTDQLEQCFKSINNLNHVPTSNNTISSSNCIEQKSNSSHNRGNNNSTNNSACEQLFTNINHFQKTSNQPFLQNNNN